MQHAVQPQLVKCQPIIADRHVQPTHHTSNRRHAMLSLAAGLALIGTRPAMATGLESIPLPDFGETPEMVQEWQRRNKGKIL